MNESVYQIALMANNPSVIKRVHDAVDQCDGAKRFRYNEPNYDQDRLTDGEPTYTNLDVSDGKLGRLENSDRNNDFYTMGHTYIDLNSHFVAQKVDANNPTKIAAEFPETIDDVEYLYQTTHGGDFMRHLMNSFSCEDL